MQKKLLQGVVPHELTAYSIFNLFLTQWIMVILLKGFKPDNWTTQFTITYLYEYLRPSYQFVECESFLESHSHDILAMWDKLGWLNWFWQFLCGRFSFFNLKGLYYSYALSCSLCKRRNSFCTGHISRKLCGFLLRFSAGFTSLIVLLLFPLLITFFIFMHSLWFYFV